tara:strand:- start:559 stop:783 length:225 start_codon:yes stop_codon:yes gene_type:complete
MNEFEENTLEAAHENAVQKFLNKATGSERIYNSYKLQDMSTGETPGYLKGLRKIGEGCYVRKSAMPSDAIEGGI